MEPETTTDEMIVTHLYQGVTREQVQATIGWPIRLADTVRPTEPPSTSALDASREMRRRTALAHGSHEA